MGTIADAQSITLQTPVPVVKAPSRNIAIDAYRGFVMLLMMGEVLQFERVWPCLSGQQHSGRFCLQSNACGVGRLLAARHDPALVFVSGRGCTSLFASPAAWRRGRREARLFLHALWRSFLLIALGVFLRSITLVANVLHV